MLKNVTGKKRTTQIKGDFKRIKDDFISIFAPPYNWNTKRTIYSIILLAVIVICFYADVPVREFVMTIHNNIYDKLFTFANWYGKPPLTIYTFILFYFGGLILIKDNIRSIGLKLFESFVFSGLVITITKSVFGRWRPYTEHGNFSFVFFTLGPNDHLSLPSGDAAVAFAFSVIIAKIFDNKLWKIFWYMLAVLTAIGRIYHDQHWLSDVFVASAISVMIGNYINKLEPKRNDYTA